MANKHHHEGTGRFKSTADVKGFNARTVAPTITVQPGSHTGTLPAPKDASKPPKR